MLGCKSNFEILFKVLNFLRLYSESIFIPPRLLRLLYSVA